MIFLKIKTMQQVLSSKIKNNQLVMLKHRMEDFGIDVTFEGDQEIWTIPASADTKYLSHSYFRYIGQFPPQIARAIIHQYGKKGGTLLDPMCGGGTTLLEARLHNMNAVGYDINKVAIIWSKARASAFQPIQFKKIIETFINQLNSIKSGTKHNKINKKQHFKSSLKLNGDEKFFSKKTLDELNYAIDIVDSLKNKNVQNLILGTILSIIRQISLANNKKMNVVVDMNSKKI